MTKKIGSGATPRGGGSVYQDTGVAFIRSQNVLDNSLDWKAIARLSDLAAADLAGVAVERGDVLLNITGDSIARCAVVDPEVLPARVSQHVAIIRPTPEMVSGFLQAALVNPEMKKHLLSISAGGTRNALTKSALGELEIPCPPLSDQFAIAEVLGALDDKIAANTALQQTADGLAYAYFERTVESSEMEPLSKVATFVNGKAFTKGATGTGRVVIRIAELNSGIGGSTVYNDIAVAEDYLARPGDLLFAWSGSLTVQRWFRPEAIINQHIFKVIPRPGYPMWLVHQLLLAKLPAFQTVAADKATTMGHIQRRHLDDPVRVPDAHAIAQMESLMTSLWDCALAAEIESLKLQGLRDSLLPELMSGRLRVRDAEKQVEAVV